VFRRADSPLWQFRYRIKKGDWHRQSTKKASLELAVEVACEAYDKGNKQSLVLQSLF
jgi:integrase